MSDIEWGKPIAVDGKRPEWLGTKVYSFSGLSQGWWNSGGYETSHWSPHITSIRLPKDHWAYLTDRDDRRVELAGLDPSVRKFQAEIWNAADRIDRCQYPSPREPNPYHHLSNVLDEALEQASEGKGRERHAQDLPFHEQPMQQLIDLYGMGFALGQAGKKMQESQRLPHDAARTELLGAIVYIAGAIVAMDRGRDETAENGE